MALAAGERGPGGLTGLPITPMGRREVLTVGGGLAVLAVGLAFLSPWASLPPALLALFVAWFFRDPRRVIPAGPGLVVSPADGVITDLEEVARCEFWEGPAVRVSIYLSVFDVHVNRVPETARVVEVRYCPGRFRNTRHVDSARDNEQCWTLFRRDAPPHTLFAVRQVAGTFARRVVCAAKPGAVLGRGDRFGMIKFGSRTELYLAPAPGLSVTARPGDRVRAGTSVLARYTAACPPAGPAAGPWLEEER
jgi:phosphatidylserine decarboxylase